MTGSPCDEALGGDDTRRLERGHETAADRVGECPSPKGGGTGSSPNGKASTGGILRGRGAIAAAIALAAAFVVATSSAALLWMARHGGGTGNPASASSDEDNMPIPLPAPEGPVEVTIILPHGMTASMTDGSSSAEWDGGSASGGLDARAAGDDGKRVAIELTLADPAGSLIVTLGDGSGGGSPSVEMVACAGTADGGTLTIEGEATGVPPGAVVAIATAAERVGVALPLAQGTDGNGTSRTTTDGADGGTIGDGSTGNKSAGGQAAGGTARATAGGTGLLGLDIRATHQVGEGDTPHAGFRVTRSASLHGGVATGEAYVTVGSRTAAADTPVGFAAGTTFLAGRTTERPGQMRSVEWATVRPEAGSKTCETPYAN